MYELLLWLLIVHHDEEDVKVSEMIWQDASVMCFCVSVAIFDVVGAKVCGKSVTAETWVRRTDLDTWHKLGFSRIIAEWIRGSLFLHLLFQKSIIDHAVL